MSDTPTPRTDAEEWDCGANPFAPAMVVSSKLARQLERELVEAKGEALLKGTAAEAMREELERVERSNAQLLSALEPFAKFHSFGWEGTGWQEKGEKYAVLVRWKDGKETTVTVTLGDFSRALDAVAKAKP